MWGGKTPPHTSQRSVGLPASAPPFAMLSDVIAELAHRFRPNMLWGAATAAYQIEGAARDDGRGDSIWDTFSRTPGKVLNGDTGDVACDHYHRFHEDVALMADLRLNAYRFSVSWPRILPEGTGRIEQRGLAFYDRLVDALLERGIRPFLTLYHWDLPQTLQDRGGWGAGDSAAWFADYAAVVAERLGDRVKDWITLNEPQVAAFVGHLSGAHAPGSEGLELALRVSHNLLRAHAEGARALREAIPDASIGIALNLSPYEPETETDAEAARLLDGQMNRWFLDPVFGRGYPDDVLKARRWSEPAPVPPSLDFLGVNYYRRLLVSADTTGPLGSSERDPPGEHTENGWEVHPSGLTEVLRRVHDDYAAPLVYVTENGAAYRGVDDPERVRYLQRHVSAAADALEAGVPLAGYFVWSLLDNFEWAMGYSMRFGLVHVDYATQQRTIKPSGRWYRDLIAANQMPTMR